MIAAKLAHSFKLGLCDDPACSALHFELQDEHGNHFATMTVAAENVATLTESMKNLTYKIVTGAKSEHDNG